MIIVPGRDTAEMDKDIAQYYQEGYSRKEIAEFVKISEGRVARRLTQMFRWGEMDHRKRYRT